jgi:hypothetical protein
MRCSSRVRELVALPSSKRTSAVVVCRIRFQRPSRWCRRRPQPGDEHQDILKHLPRHSDLGELERDVAAVADDLAPILISFSRRLVSDHGSAALGITSVRMKLPRL